MHGRVCEDRKRVRHMWTAPSRVTASVNADVSSSSSSSSNSFCKDGRKISVGDCALFKPPQDSPPFIGLIRWVTAGKENKLRLGVNWLYRPAEVKLGKGILLDAAPNEIFYSFHKDEIPAASLLHPCKVAFLPKGVELPSGICSFVCRRVYDITNKCLWWLTDQDYIDERQEEVDLLLYNTRLEMHATLQPGGRSPKPMNGPTPQLKPSSDSVQNSASIPSQVKGKKRERVDQGSEPVKRERSMKMEDGDSGYGRSESFLKSEIAKITEKGGLVDSEGVEKLVQLMLPERNDKKIDLGGRSVLAGVVAATDKFDCLSRFVQLRGLPVFDEWLQEVHKGKIGDGYSPKDGDKSVEEFLLILLRALDKLPVNLHALQMCNIGKSVNHLRSHKNLEIQKKARSLVDTWKKRVEAEMDAKSGSNQGVSWPARPRLPETSHGGNRHSGGSSDVAMKSSVTQVSTSKAAPVKLVQGENTLKSASPSPGSMKSTPSPASASTSLKDGQPRNTAVGGASDLPLSAARDEKSSSSSQSHNNSQSCSSDHAKTGGFSVKEDARSSTAGSMTVNKNSGSSSRHRKAMNGFPGSALSGARETGSSKSSSMQRNTAPEKLSQSTLTCEKLVDVSMGEGNSHKLIVKIPNRGRSPAQSVSGGSFEDPSVMNSRASSPVLSEKHDQFDRNLKEKGDTYQSNVMSDVNAESWQRNDFKDVTGSDEGDLSPAAALDEEHCRTGNDTRKVAEISKASSSSSGNELKSVKLHETSFSSINALIESCVKYSESNASMPAGDDVGMNLLASVAAGEMSKSDMVSPTNSPTTPVVENYCSGNDARVKLSPADEFSRDQSQSTDGTDAERDKQGAITGTSWAKTTDIKTVSMPVGDFNGNLISSSKDVQPAADHSLESKEKLNNVIMAASATVLPTTVEKTFDGDGSKEIKEKKASGVVDADHISDTKQKVSNSLVTEGKIIESGLEVNSAALERTVALLETSNDEKGEQKQPMSVMTSENVLLPSGSDKDMVLGNGNEVNSEKAREIDTRNHFNPTEKPKADGECSASVDTENQVMGGFDSSAANHKTEHVAENLDSNEVNEQCRDGPSPPKVSSPYLVQETESRAKPRGSKLTSNEADEAEECTSTTRDTSSVSAAGGSDMDAKVEFDLNEGFNADDGRCGDSNHLTAPGSSAPVQLISPLPFPVSSLSSGLPASITVAAPAKGPFVPPEDLLRTKGALGWKGSAATSAFRPAEPRRVMEMPLGAINISPPDATTSKQNRLLLDIDLNVPQERVLEDLASQSSAQVPSSVSDCNRDSSCDEILGSPCVRSSGGLDLDLNRVDEPADIGHPNNNHRLNASFQPVKSSSDDRLNDEVTVRRDFDLNNGPSADEVSAEPSTIFSQHARSSVPSQPTVSGLRVSSNDMGSFSSWFPVGNAYSAITIPSILPDRGEQPFPIVASGGPQRMLGPNTGATPFSPDVYRGPVLSSSPAVPFPSTPFQYPVFPFGTSFPLPSTTFSGGSTTYVDSPSGGRLCFPAVHSQLLGPASAVPSNYPRPYVVSLPDGSSNGGTENSRKWLRQGLDLNAGPGGPEMEVRDENSLASRQLSASSQALAEEQARMYQVAGGVLKRKEPEGGWDGYKQSSWQ